QPAIGIATKGFTVSNRFSSDINDSATKRLIAKDSVLARIYLPNGAAPVAGTVFKEPELAHTLSLIASQGADVLYHGPIAAKIAAYMEHEGGLVTAADLAAHKSEWTEPIETTYRGRRVLAFPPNSQGMTLLEELNIADLYDLKAMGHNSTAYVHTMIETARIAYADRDATLADPRFAKVPVVDIISKQRAAAAKNRIGDHASSVVVDTTRD